METYPNVLVLEDDLIEIKKIQRAFKKLNLNELAICENGVEGVNFLVDDKNPLPDIILLDLNMPKMNGLEFLAYVKNNNQFKRIPVIVFTTSSNLVDIEFCFDFSVAGYMLKPVDHIEYLDTLKALDNYWNTSKLLVQ